MSIRVIEVVGAAIIAEGRCLVAQRAADSAEPLQWEFPGGKVEPGESPQAALRREIQEELGLQIAVGRHIGRGMAHRPSGKIHLDVYAATILAGTPVAKEHAAFGWFDAAGLAGLDWAEADVPVIAAARRLLGGLAPR